MTCELGFSHRLLGRRCPDVIGAGEGVHLTPYYADIIRTPSREKTLAKKLVLDF
jgi:hypothetical protein